MLTWLTRRGFSKRTRSLAGFGAWILVLKFLRQASSLGATMALVRAFSTDEYGDYQFVITLIGVCGVFALPGMQSVIVQSVARGFPGTFREANKWSWRVSFGGSAVMAGVAGWMWGQGEAGTAAGLAIGALLFPAANGILNWQSYQAGRQQFKATAIHQGLSLVVGNGLIVAACFSNAGAIWIPVACYYGVMAVQNLRMTRLLLRDIPVDAETEPGALGYGFRTSIYGIANSAANYLDRVLLFTLVSPEALAIYAVADRIPELLKKNLQSLNVALVPDLARTKEYSPSLNRKFNRAGLILCAVVFVLMFGVVPWAIPLLFTEAFVDSIVYCQLLLLSLCLGLFATLKFSYIQAKMDETSFRDVTLLMSGARIGLSVLLVPLYGLMGAAIATILYRVVTFSVVGYYLRRFHMAAVDQSARAH